MYFYLIQMPSGGYFCFGFRDLSCPLGKQVRSQSANLLHTHSRGVSEPFRVPMCACSGPVTKHIEDLEAHIRAMYDDLVAEFARKKEQGLVRF